jgi:hypothetical protein
MLLKNFGKGKHLAFIKTFCAINALKAERIPRV